MTNHDKEIRLKLYYDQISSQLQPVRTRCSLATRGDLLISVLCVSVEYWKPRFSVDVNIEVLEIGDCWDMQW